jgi:hypothetical protein
LGYVTSVSGTTGRITSTGGTAPIIDLASGVIAAGTTGSVTAIPVITVDTYGRVTSITTAANPQGTVTSVGLSLPSIMSVSGSPVTSSGTLTGTLTTQAVNAIFAGPSSGAAAAPTFRSLTTADIPALSYVTSVTGTSPVVSSGGATPAISLATAYGDTLNPYSSKTANYFLGAPNGSAGVPTFRALATADIPALAYVTSVALSLPSIMTVSGSPVTSSGTLTGTLTTQSVNTLFAGPSSGAAAAPTFRALTTADIPALSYVTSVAATVPSFLSIAGSPITSSGTLAISYSGTALPIANGGTGQTTAAAAFNALSPVTTTGDLIIGNGTNSAIRLGIGSNGLVLTSNGTTATWAASSGSTGPAIYAFAAAHG